MRASTEIKTETHQEANLTQFYWIHAIGPFNAVGGELYANLKSYEAAG